MSIKYLSLLKPDFIYIQMYEYSGLVDVGKAKSGIPDS